MKSGVHPESYRFVVFRDAGVDKSWLMRSTVPTSKTVKWEDGNEYPLCEVDISSASHPFYTGKQRLVDTQGRVEKFYKKYQMGKPAASESDEAAEATKEE